MSSTAEQMDNFSNYERTSERLLGEDNSEFLEQDFEEDSEEEDEGAEFAFGDEFEEHMDNFWNDGKSSKDLLADEISLDNEEEEVEEEKEEERVIEGLEELSKDQNDVISKILDDEGESLFMAEEMNKILQDEKQREKVSLDKLNVAQLINMVARVKLTWPEDMPYYNAEEFAMDPIRENLKESFYHCTDKEKTALWYAENFRRQFVAQFPKRRALVIAPPNEVGCQKVYSTYINPAVLGYPEFLDATTCAAYLKEYFSPEFMDPPSKYPEKISSHYTVLKSRKVNCFEFAIVLASFLIGVGYDAYVVDGYASKAIVFNDATEDFEEEPELTEEEILAREKDKKDRKKEADAQMAKFDFLMNWLQEEEVEELERPTSPSKYRFKKRKKAEEEEEEEEEKEEEESSNLTDMVDEPFTDEQRMLLGLPSKEEEEESSGETTEKEESGEELEGTKEREKETLEEEDESEDKEEDKEGDGEGENEGEEKEQNEEVEGEEEKASVKPKRVRPLCPDRYYGMRTHAWILIKEGTREVEAPYFIEPFSGTKMAIDDENFFGVETIFNHRNFWVNLQDPMEVFVEGMDWDLDDASKWSKLLVEPEKKKKEAEDALFQDEEDEVKHYELLFDMPISWTPDPDISQEDYERRYPGGTKTINYNNANVEQAAPYVNEDGLTKKVLKFKDKGRDPDDLEYIEEIFENRKDKLIKRKWFREGRIVHEYFNKGRKDALKEHAHISGKNKSSYPRDLYYYANAHPQCVSHRQIIHKGMVEHFEGRDDFLYYRLSRFGSMICDQESNNKRYSQPVSKSKAKEFMDMLQGGGSPGKNKRRRRKILKIVEKYHRDERKDAEEDVAEKHMLIEEGRLHMLFHCRPGNLSRNILEFYKPKGSNVATADFHAEDCIEYLADPHAQPTDVYRKFKLLQRMEADQRVALVLAAQAEEEVYETVTSRIHEDFHHDIEPDPFAGEKNDEYMRMKEQIVIDDDDEVEEDFTGVDFASPFFEKYGIPRNKMEEVLMKKRIMLHAKVRLVKKAHGIRDAYEREADRLSEKMKWFDQLVEKLSPDQEEEFNKMYRERLFDMHILEKRLIRHQELAPKKYYNLLLKVLKHPELNKYSNKKIPPPPPPVPDDNDDGKGKVAVIKDCCQFYSYKFAKPKEEKTKQQQQHADEQQVIWEQQSKAEDNMDEDGELEADPTTATATATFPELVSEIME